MRGRDDFDAEPFDQMVEPLAIGVHVGELGPEQREIREHRRHVRQIQRDRLLGKQTAVAVEMIVAVSKPVAGKQHPLARFEAPPGRAQVTDYRLDRHQAASAEIDRVVLGGRSLMAVEPVIRDLRTTWWGFETRERVLFPGDGFAYSHYHLDGHCGLLAEEAVSLDLPDVSAVFADLALFWTKFADMDAYCERLDRLIERLSVQTIAPTHGLPITDVKATVPKVQEGLKAAALVPESGTNEKVAAAAS